MLGVLLLIANCTSAQNYPIMLGYCTAQSVSNVTDSFSVSCAGGMFAPQQWKNHLDNGTAPAASSGTLGDKWLSGFVFNTMYIENAFRGELFVSKGYFGDYVELKWDLERYLGTVTGFVISRKPYGSNDDFVQVANLPNNARNWQDQYSESNVLYEYKLMAKGITPIQKVGLNYLLGVGFRMPTGRVTGRVTYAGGAAVPGVSVIAETTDNFSGSSLLLNGITDLFDVITLGSLKNPLLIRKTFISKKIKDISDIKNKLLLHIKNEYELLTD